MRWKKPTENKKWTGERKDVFFAWFPYTIYDETRWLERVGIIRRYYYDFEGNYRIEDKRFVNKKQ